MQICNVGKGLSNKCGEDNKIMEETVREMER